MKYGKRMFMIMVSMIFLGSWIQGQGIVKATEEAAEEDWQFEVCEDSPLDTVEFHVVDEHHGNAIYYVGYRHGKVAIMNEKLELVAQTEYDEVETEKVFDDVYAYTYYKGNVALKVRIGNKYGLCDLNGRELLPVEYDGIKLEENREGHGLFSTQRGKKEEIWIDGKYKVKGISYAFLATYKGKVYVFGVASEEDSYYTYCNLQGKKMGTLEFDALFKYTSVDTDWYQDACEKWLTKKGTEAEKKVTAYYESMGYGVEETSFFTAYNYVNGRKEDMYYYLVVQADINYDTGQEGMVSLGRTNYVFIYTKDQTLLMEGQTNLSEDDKEEHDVLMLNVTVLTKDGTIYSMERYTGEIKTLYTTDSNSLFLEEDNCTKEYFEKYNLNGILEKKEYTTSYEEKYVSDITNYFLEYKRNYLYGIGRNHKIYVLTSGELVNYDWRGEQSVYGIALNEKETQLYYIADKSIPIGKVEVSTEQLNRFPYNCYVNDWNNTAWISHQAKRVYFNNETYNFYWDYEEVGIQNGDCTLVGFEEFDGVYFFCVEEAKIQYNPYSVTIKYYSFCVNTKNGRKTFLGESEQKPEIVDGFHNRFCHATIDSNCYVYVETDIFADDESKHLLYTINTENLTMEERELNMFGKGKTEAVASLEAIHGKPYIRYTIPRDEESKFYGYMDLEGNIKIDPLLTRIYESESIWRDDTKCKQLGEYIFFGHMMFDLDFQVVAKDIRTIYFLEYDEKRDSYDYNGLISFYNRYNNNQFLGFLYDENREKIIKKYDKLADVYTKMEKIDKYYACTLSENAGVAWFQPDTMEEIGREKGYAFNNQEKKSYIVIPYKKKSKDTLIFKDCFYRIKGNVYQITNTKKRTVSFIETSSTAKNITIPDTVKIAGKTFHVTAINEGALKGNTKVTKITIGKNVTKVGAYAFSNCKKLKTIVIKGKKLKTIRSNALKGTGKKVVIKVPSGKKKS